MLANFYVEPSARIRNDRTSIIRDFSYEEKPLSFIVTPIGMCLFRNEWEKGQWGMAILLVCACAPWNWLRFGSLSIQTNIGSAHPSEHVCYSVLCIIFFPLRSRTYSFSFLGHYLFWLKWRRLHTPIQSRTRRRCCCWFQSFILSHLAHMINHSGSMKIIIINKLRAFFLLTFLI